MERMDVVLKEFFHLASIPHPSHHEERVSEYLYTLKSNATNAALWSR